MSSRLLDMFRGIAEERGVELDEGELVALGLSDDDEGRPAPDGDVLAVDLPGEASGAVEIFLSREAIGLDKPIESGDGLMWEPIIREGQWAVRPGGRTGKRRKPLKVIAGHSQSQRKELGLQDLLDAYNDDAIEYVTVPTSHQNHVLENTGFIKGMKIVEGTVKPRKKTTDLADDGTKVKVLMGGYDIRIPAVKERMDLGTIASRSAGILYDYVNTESGKTYPAVVEHVALTNKPWITGMTAFGRKLKGKVLDIVGLSLSDEEPDDEDFLAQDDALEGLELAAPGSSATIAWDHEQSPNWLQTQVTQLLEQARSEKRRKLQQDRGGSKSLYVDYDTPPYYRCVEARPGPSDNNDDLSGSALISDGWGDSANYWIAPITVKDGVVNLSKFSEWQATKKVWVADERPAPAKNMEPLDKNGSETSEAAKPSRLKLAQRARRARAKGEDHTHAGSKDAGAHETNDNHPRGGEHMAGESGGSALQLSEEAQRAIQAAEDRARQAEEKADRLSQTVDRLTATSTKAETSGYISELKADGFDEEHGWGGVLTVVRDLMMADDGEPAVQADSFSDETNTTGELSLSDAIRRIFAAVKRGEDGKIALGDQVSEPAQETEAGAGGETKETETGTEAGKTGAGEKKEKLADGKPGPGSGEEEEDLSDEANLAKLRKESPIIAEALGLDQEPEPAAAGSNGTRKGAEA